jgi:DNA topoisomerase-1
MASQMANALLDTVSVEVQANGHIFKASGYSVRFDGFTVVYEEGRDDENEGAAMLPPLEVGEKLDL